jgi:hypothetical protein
LRVPGYLRSFCLPGDNTNVAEVAKTNAAVAVRKRTVRGVLVKVKWAQSPASGPAEYPTDLTDPADPKSVLKSLIVDGEDHYPWCGLGAGECADPSGSQRAMISTMKCSSGVQRFGTLTRTHGGHLPGEAIPLRYALARAIECNVKVRPISSQ